MGKANKTNCSARPGHVNSHVHGLKRANTLQDRFGPAVRLLQHVLYRLLISRRDDIGGPKGLPQFQPLFLVSDEQDACGSQTFRGP